MIDLSEYSTKDLLALNAGTLRELKNRKVIRTNNSPVGDYAEKLVVDAYGMKQAANSEKSYDATDLDNLRVQIKARRVVNG